MFNYVKIPHKILRVFKNQGIKQQSNTILKTANFLEVETRVVGFLFKSDSFFKIFFKLKYS